MDFTNQDNELPEVYYGLYPEQVIYANTPASNNRLSVKFRDCEVIVANLKLLDSYDCFFRGDPAFVSQAVLSDIVVSASNAKGMTVRVIYPHQRVGITGRLRSY